MAALVRDMGTEADAAGVVDAIPNPQIFILAEQALTLVNVTPGLRRGREQAQRALPPLFLYIWRSTYHDAWMARAEILRKLSFAVECNSESNSKDEAAAPPSLPQATRPCEVHMRHSANVRMSAACPPHAVR